ncbi:MAG: cyclic nucleotide-binding domain-containing protein, partial [Actinomycetota bacterium]
CLLACPLPESQLVTIAELNQAVTSESIQSPNVMDFVMKCTQCQQCVPVCPADLRRSDIVLWNKMKVESVAPNYVLPLQVGELIYSSPWTVDALTGHLLTLPLFTGVQPLTMRRSLLSATLRRLGAGEVLVHEGGYHERLVVVLDGALEQTAEVAYGYRNRILVLGPGTFHGHMAVMSASNESYTVSALEDSTIVEFNKAVVFQMMKEAATFADTMESLYKQNAVWAQAKSSSVFGVLPEEAIQWLLERSDFQILKPGQVLYREGDAPDTMYLVRDGFLKVSRRYGDRERVLQYFHDGDVCGAGSVLFNQPRSATVTANTRSEVVAIPGDALNALLQRNPSLRERLTAESHRAEQYLYGVANTNAQRTDSSARSTDHLISLEGLLEEGVVQGSEVLLINTAVCTNCNNCVDACERRHGYSRLYRGGLQMGDLLFPTACRHCDDPVCLMCSVNGIVREPDGEIRIVPENCIGCGACAERCPYGNINMYPRIKQRSNRWHKLLSFFTGEMETQDDDEFIHSSEVKGNRIAVKCDLCSGYSDYACVTACPVGAAMRINPVEVFGRSDVVVGMEMAAPQMTPQAPSGGPF